MKRHFYGFTRILNDPFPRRHGYAPRRSNGFTLAELLIVVAIIAVLVAVSMPIFTSRLEKSREATDMANMRSAKAAVAVALIEDKLSGDYYFNAERGSLVPATSSALRNLEGYGKGTSGVGEQTNTQDNYEPGVDYRNAVIHVVFYNDYARLEWITKSGIHITGTDDVIVGELVN